MKQVTTTPPLTALQIFGAQTGFSRATLWRMEKKGWLKTINICGRKYVSSEAIAEFKERAEAGEFASEHKTPKRGGQD